MKNIRVFLSENFQFWELKFSIYFSNGIRTQRLKKKKIIVIIIIIIIIIKQGS